MFSLEDGCHKPKRLGTTGRSLMLCMWARVVSLTLPPLFLCPQVEQLPTITAQSPSPLIAFPFDESFPVTCEAKGNPKPE